MDQLQKYLLSFLCIILIPIFLSCNSKKNDKKEYIEKELILFLDSKISIEDVGLIPINLADSIMMKDYLSSKYKIYSFVDSMNCSSCQIVRLRKWKDLFKNLNPKLSPIIIIFNTQDVLNVKKYMELYGLDFPYFLDFENKFKQVNKQIPKKGAFRTFLTRNDTVIVVGNPINNKKIEKLYRTEISKH
jgi:hypothetical protein